MTARIPRSPRRHPLAILGALLVVPGLALAAPSRDAAPPAAGRSIVGVPMTLAGSGVVHLGELARAQARIPDSARPPVRPLIERERINEEFTEPFSATIAPATSPAQVFRALAASPSPNASFKGLDDIPMVDSSFIIIPPDVNGAVGPTKIIQNLNNNVRILDKTGAVLSTVGVNTFWAPSGASANNYTDPHTVFDPYNHRFIAIMQGDLDNSTGNSLVIALSDTDDPAGTWHMFRTILHESNTIALADYPTLGFNKNWITVSINMYRSSGILWGNSVLAIHYPSLRSGTFTAFRFDIQNGFCGAPVQTYSATADTEYVLAHLSSSSGTYRRDLIIGTGPAAPTYTLGGTLTRPGGGWLQGSGNTSPQSAPNSGTSSCGSTPCPVELIDAQIRTAPVFRDGTIWYVQTVGLGPSTTITHTAAQWTRITTPSGAFVEGGRIEDPTATTTAGEWYTHPQIAVNAAHDFIVSFSNFSATHHPSMGYAVHQAADAAGTIRDPFIAKPGEDYYHKDFGSGRNRWGDFSSAQVDPSDDATLWAVAEYAKSRVGTDDGGTGSNSSRWSTWWASVGPAAPPPTFTITASAGANGSISPSGAVSVTQGASQSFTIAADTCFTVADVLVDGSSVGAVTAFTFTNVQASHTISASFALRTYTITASAGSGGSISPSGSIPVNCGGSQGFTITAATGHSIADVLVDGGSVGAVTGFSFTNIKASHTIAASFATDSFTVTTSVTGVGTVQRSPNLAHYLYGSTVTLTATPGPGWAFTVWSGDTATTANPFTATVFKNLAFNAAFADTAKPSVTVLAPAGGAVLDIGTTATLGWSAADNMGITGVDLLLSRVGAAGPYDTLATGVSNTGSFSWPVTGPATSNAFLEVLAHDAAGNTGSDVSDTAFVIQGTTAVGPTAVTEFMLERVTPQPVRGTARLRFALPRSADIRLSVHDALGREVAVLAEGTFDAGEHVALWSEAGAAPGLYFVSLRVPGHTFIQKLVRLR